MEAKRFVELVLHKIDYTTFKANKFIDLKFRRLGFFPRNPYAHYFLHDGVITSTVHIHNFYSVFFPDLNSSIAGRAWFHNSTGKLVHRKNFTLSPFGQVYLSAADILNPHELLEGMVYVDLKPSKEIRKKLSTLPGSEDMRSQVPFWVSYVDDDQNFMYVHSIENYKGKTFGWHWPISTFSLQSFWLKRAKETIHDDISWKSWRILEVTLLSELEILVINHSSKKGKCQVQIWGDHDAALWSQSISLKKRESRRVKVPAALIKEWSELQITQDIRVGIQGMITPNGKPYVLMRYGQGPRSLHHG